MTDWPVHARIDGPIVMIGFGSIGKGTLPLIERHFSLRQVAASSSSTRRTRTASCSTSAASASSTRPSPRTITAHLLTPLLTAGGGQGFCVNLSVDTSSLDIMELCREIGALYIDTVVEPWLGFYFDPKLGPEARSNYALRETDPGRPPQASRAGRPRSSCCGANPGMVSWFVKQALLNVAGDTGAQVQGAEDARGLGPARQEGRRQGHPHRRARHPARQAAEADGRLRQHLVGRRLHVRRHAAGRTRLGHAREVDAGQRAASTRPAARPRSICCSPAPIRACAPGRRPRAAQYGFLVTHNESISIADYFTLRQGRKVDLPADLPLRLSPLQRRGAVAA